MLADNLNAALTRSHVLWIPWHVDKSRKCLNLNIWNDKQCLFQENLRGDLWAKTSRTHLQSTKTLPKAWPWPCMFSSQKNYVFPECGCELPWASSRCACVRVAPAFAARAAQRSMRLSKHGMAAGARSQGWGQEEGMRLGGNKSKFLWNDLTGNDRVSALYNHTAREREGGRSSS